MDSQLFNIKTLAQRWGVHPVTVRKMAKRGEIKYFRVGDEFRFTQQAIMEHEGWNQESLNSDNTAGDTSLSGTSQ